MKKIAVIYYSQSGRTQQVIDRLKKNNISPGEEVSFSFFQIEPEESFSFPWSFSRFFDAFPESVLKPPLKLLPLKGTETYDLILFVYPVWYLSPAIPVSSFLQSSDAKKFIKNTPVITLLTCRDMWIEAQHDVKKSVATLGSKVIGNIVLRDEYNSFQSLVTTLYWFLVGKNKKPFGIFPSPLIKEHQLKKIDSIKKLVIEKTSEEKLKELQPIFIENGYIILDDYKIILESRVKKIFIFWAKFVQRAPSSCKRKGRLLVFQAYLLFAILIIMPISFLVSSMVFPFIKEKIKKMRQDILIG